MRPVLITVIICTRNRADHLHVAISSALAQDFTRADYEVLVVDNGSTDHTPQVIEGFRGDRRLRAIRESKVGLNPARNAGWRAARGARVVYLDDDAVAEPDWLAAIDEAFAVAGARPAVVGGRVDPIWLASRPDWLSDALAVALPIVDWGTSVRPLAEVPREWLAGVNIAMPVALLEEIGGFDPRLDRAGNNLLSNGEILIQREAQRRGYQCLYHPGMRVRHTVPPGRLTQRWFRHRYYWQGISDAVMEIIETGPAYRRRVRQAARRSLRLLRSGALHNVLRRTRDPQAFTRQCFTLIEVGRIAGLLGVGRQ